ncbi:ion channel [Marinagarivorans algicola]|uniref:ion channel n=1 Tax=Marinagarivorans algicola TaxID=1513270 RepID=UPI003736A68B
MLLISRFLQVHRRRRLTKHLSGNIFKRISKLVLLLACFIAINTAVMVFVEEISLGNAIWLSFTTLTTVGYGDYSASTFTGRTVTIITMYIFSISLLSLIIAETIDWKLLATSKKIKGLWEFADMANHIQIINTPNSDTERYLQRLITEIKATPALADLPVQLLTRKYPKGLPDSLSALKVIHRTGMAEDGVIINHINLEKAKHIIILARDAYNSLSDSLTFDLLSRVVEINPNTNIIVEAVLDDNRQRFLALGASAVIRPIRAYPGMVARALSHPGTERVLEDLFEAHGDSLHKAIYTFKDITWGDLVTTCIKQHIGTPLGYFDQGHIIMQPHFDQLCTGEALILLVKEGKTINLDSLQSAL